MSYYNHYYQLLVLHIFYNFYMFVFVFYKGGIRK